MNGGFGPDTLFGGRGNDTFVFGNSTQPSLGDIVNGGQGFADRILVESTAQHDLSRVTISNVENLAFGATGATAFIFGSQLLGAGEIAQVIGGAGIDRLTVTGSSVNLQTLVLISWTGGVDILRLTGTSSSDMQTGSTGGHTFDVAGGSGLDLVIGGAGNDIYIVDQDEVIQEAVGTGTADRVRVLLSYVLSAGPDIEFLETADALEITAINLTGNAVVQIITGNAGANRLDGRGGQAERLGRDRYILVQHRPSGH